MGNIAVINCQIIVPLHPPPLPVDYPSAQLVTWLGFSFIFSFYLFNKAEKGEREKRGNGTEVEVMFDTTW